MKSSRHSRADERVTHLVHLAQRHARDEMSAQEQAGLGRLEQALAQRRARTGGTRRGWVALAAVAAAVLLLVAPRFWRTNALSFEVVRGTVSEGGYVQPAQGEEALVRFSDGSEVALDPETHARVADLRREGARMLVEGGRARVHVRHRADTKWTVEAGPFMVHVTGTEFDISWASADELLDLRLHKGSVVLNGPLTPGGVGVTAGQRLIADLRRGTVTIGQDTSETEAPPTTDAVASPAVQEAPAAPASGPMTVPEGATGEPTHDRARPRTPRPGRGADEWGGLVSQGQFGAVLDEAEHHGVAATLSRAPLDDLAALADAARYMRRDDLARRAYVAERGRFPNARRAHEAAFFLGGLAEGDSELSAALDWYDRYLSEAPTGAYAAQALGHKMLLVRKLQGAAAAAQVARDYLQRFPDGPYASSAKKLMAP
jgi:ferric-dicitrate binding protein FerR (iron transport regulator)